MGKDTLIEWCDRTWSPYYGCVNVSAGCENCYADAGSSRNPAVFGKWGPPGIGNRRVAAESSWDKVLGWEREAERTGQRLSVFPSWCDPFEDWSGEMVDSKGRTLYLCGNCQAPGGWFPWQPLVGGSASECECGEAMRPATMDDVRRRFADLIRQTPHLDWLLLTKRPQNAAAILMAMFGSDRSTWPTNFRVGTSIENQATADERLPYLLRLDWPNFVSYEPALGPVNLERYLGDYWCPACQSHSIYPGDKQHCPNCGFEGDWDHNEDPCPECKSHVQSEMTCPHCGTDGGNGGLDFNECWSKRFRPIDWLIAGGESGPGARPAHPDWFRQVRDQCHAARVLFLFKQWGEWMPLPGVDPHPRSSLVRAVFPDGSDLPDLTGRGSNGTHASRMARVGKKAAGRTLDGLIHDEFPPALEVANRG